jgi:hypothetical protein
MDGTRWGQGSRKVFAVEWVGRGRRERRRHEDARRSRRVAVAWRVDASEAVQGVWAVGAWSWKWCFAAGFLLTRERRLEQL